MSRSVMVRATLVMLPASLVRVRALKALSCRMTYSGCWPATRGISFCPDIPPRWHMVHRTSSAFFLPRATRAASGLNAMGLGFWAAKYSARSSMSSRDRFATIGSIEGSLRLPASGSACAAGRTTKSNPRTRVRFIDGVAENKRPPSGGLRGSRGSGQGEYHHAVAALEVDLGIAARRDGDVLLALHRVGHRGQIDAGPGLVLPQQLSALGVQGLEQAVALAEEHQSPGGGERAADERLLGVVLPRDLAGVDVDRREASPLLLARYGLECAAEPQLAAARIVRGLDVIGHGLMQVE